MLEDYINQLVLDLEIQDDVTTDNKDVYLIQLDETIAVNITDLKPGFSFLSPIAKLPEQRHEDLFTQLMSANLFGQGTGEGVLGLNSTGKLITLYFAVNTETDYQEFRDRLEDFTNYVDLWQIETEELLENQL